MARRRTPQETEDPSVAALIAAALIAAALVAAALVADDEATHAGIISQPCRIVAATRSLLVPNG